MKPSVRLLSVRIATVAAWLGALSCAAPTDPGLSPSLEEMLLAPITDSGGTTVGPPDSAGAGPGYVHGTLMGSGSGSGLDTLATKPRVAGAAVTVHRIIEERSGLPPKIGPAIATTYTDAEGRFTTPVIEADPDGYVMIFSPPASSAYAPVWTYAWFWPDSHVYPWWVTAPLR